MSGARWKYKNATEQSFGGEHHFLYMLDTINGELRTNNYYTGLCRENLLYTPTFEKKSGHIHMKYNVFVWPVVVLREALKKKLSNS